MFPGIEYIKTCLNGVRQRIETIEKSGNQALAQVKAQVLDIIQDIKNIRIESVETVKSSTADWGQNDSNALDYVKNRTHYMLPATPIGSLEFTATSSSTIAYTMLGAQEAEEEFAIFQYFQNLAGKGEVLKVTVGGKTGLLATDFSHGYFNFSGVLAGTVKWDAGNVLSLVAQNNFITFNQGNVYTVSFEDTTKPYYSKLDFNYMPDNVYHSENAPVKFGTGRNSSVQGELTTATGVNAHAEGRRTKASGSEAHAEGNYSEASGMYSHAEGDNTVASGMGAHAEGYDTVANRKYMHVEGEKNLYDSATYVDEIDSDISWDFSGYYAASEYRFDPDTGYYTLIDAEVKPEAVLGLYYALPGAYTAGTIKQLRKLISARDGGGYNTERHTSTLGVKARGKYIHVAGNGSAGTGSYRLSNAYTLDWEGVPWFQGRPQFGGTAQDDGSQTVMANGDSEIVLRSPGGKEFRITVDDTGTLSATEVTSQP